MKLNNKVFCVISHTHWDREWYMPLENFRHRLVDLMDRLLVILEENPAYIFHLDAQTVVLEDYLTVRPEKREQLRQYVSRRRLMVGPWYLQNDFYLTSGESTVRNLLEGQKLCREFGGSGKTGYAADQFGNVSQLPQIMRGFGIDNFIFGRGFSRFDVAEDGTKTPKATPTEFIWKGPDGSEVLAIHMRHWYNNAQRFSADIDKSTRFLESIARHYDNDLTFTPYLLLMNGVDHLEAQPDILQVAEAVQKRLPEGQHFLQYNMDDYVDAVKEYVDANGVRLDEVCGELRCDYGITVLQGTLSSRAYLKAANAEAQVLMENRLEPLYAMLEKQGMYGIYPHDRLTYTWKNILRNHPHDSICGCSHDAVHAHMENRYAEIMEFGEEQLRRGVLTAAEHTAASRKGGERDYLVTVANTLAIPLTGTVAVDIKMLCSDDMERFRILDEDGNPVAFQVVSKEKTLTNVFSPINLPGVLEVFKYRLYLDAGTVNPYSFKTFLITAGDELQEPAPLHGDVTEAVVSNDILKLAVSPEGKVELTDLRTGRILPDCLRLEDMADAGESYAFRSAPDDTPLYSDGFVKTVEVTEDTPFVHTVTVTYALELPAGYIPETGKRTEETKTTVVKLALTLRKGQPYMEIGYTLDNASRDHRLRLCVDTDMAPEASYADSPFDIVRRTNDQHFPNTPAKIVPNASFAALQENGKGVAVFTVGAHEYEHPETCPSRLAFTLVRATGRINGGATENWIVPGNQCLRRLSGRMAICPFSGDLIAADIPNLSLAFRAPLLAGFSACDTRKFAGGRPCVQDTTLTEFFYLPDTHPAVAIPSNRSAIQVNGKGVSVSAFKLSEDESGLILRLYNYTDAAADVTVEAAGRIFRTRLDEIPRAFIGNDRVSLTMGPKEILTLYIQNPVL
ncbi:MAG: hypothetical protein J6K98_02300, partial [Clostridia bacterium]|nr:hypothetical protein [Clostridia bacterium]